MDNHERMNNVIDSSVNNQRNVEQTTNDELADNTTIQCQNKKNSNTLQDYREIKGDLDNDFFNIHDKHENTDDIPTEHVNSQNHEDVNATVNISNEENPSTNMLLTYDCDKTTDDCVSNSSSKSETTQDPTLRQPNVNPVPDEFDLVPYEFDLLPENRITEHSTNLLKPSSPPNKILSTPEDSIVISNSNAIPRTDNIVDSNCSLAQLLDYESDESVKEDTPTIIPQYRVDTNRIGDSDKDSDSDSSSSSSSTSILVSDSSDSDSEDLYENVSASACKPIKAKKELGLEDLPPIEDLKISVPEEECVPIGKVFQIVDQLVVVEALKDLPAYNLDTVLFLEGGQPLGKIFDVFGPVTQPYYCVRFNSREHIQEKNISLNQIVYCAPKTKHTKYVFVAQLIKLKGSDASWVDDEEPPEQFLDYSDDEQERNAKKKKTRNKKAVYKVDSDPDEPASKRHFTYERRMNQRNLQMSFATTFENPSTNRSGHFKNIRAPIRPPIPRPSSANPWQPDFRPVSQLFGRPPVFNTSVPPPNMPFSPPPCQFSSASNFPDSFSNMPSPPANFINTNAPPLNAPQRLPRGGPGLPNNPETYSFPPPPPPCQHNFPPAPINARPPNDPVQNSFWPKPHRNSPPRDFNFRNNNLPPAPMWAQQTPPPPSAIGHMPVSSPPDIPFRPNRPPPGAQPFWPTQFRPQPPPQRPINFNPNFPPPLPNQRKL